MFNGNRRFDGRQGEQILNQEQYVLYEILKHFLDVPDNPAPSFGPDTGLEKPGALWLDRQTSPGFAHVMYHDNDDMWKPLFDDWFKIIKEIRNSGQPEHPREGQLWINDMGIMHWYNGSSFVPIKSSIADDIDFNAQSFQNFLVIDPLKMTGGYIVENLSKLTQISEGIQLWRPNFLYQKDTLVYYMHMDEIPRFYKYEQAHTSCLTFDEELIEGHIKEIDLKAQYLIPSEYLDKLFISGSYANDDVYDKISDICIQISLNIYQGKVVTAVHVNPVALKNIRKKIVRIEKDPTKFNDYGMIKVGPENTEYYGFNGSYGQLLQKGIDYITKANGIQLIKKSPVDEIEYDIEEGAFNEFDFIYCITYDFENKVKSQGKLYKDTVKLGNRTVIWIGEILPSDKLLIFTQGLCLEDFYYYYEDELVYFNGFDSNGNITDDVDKMTKPLFESKTHVAVMRFDKKTNIGVLTPENLDNTTIDEGETLAGESYINDKGQLRFVARVPIPQDYIKPLVFVQGPHLNMTLGDFTVESNEAVIQDAIPGSAYYIVDGVRRDGFNMVVSEGVVDETLQIPVNDVDILTGECQALVFVDGFYISTKDLDLTTGSIRINGLTEGQEYVLLKDKLDDKYQLLYDDEVAFTTIPIKNTIDDAILYIGDRLIVDGGACYSTNLETTGISHNEIRLMFANGKEQWHYFDSTIKSGPNNTYIDGVWKPIENTEFIALLNLASSGYSVSEKTINILQNFGVVDCTYYAYRFADNIEKPLVKGYTIGCVEQDNELFYKIDRKHSYTKGVNALHVWINGIKQVIRENTLIEDIDGVPVVWQGFNILKPGYDSEEYMILEKGKLDINKLAPDLKNIEDIAVWPTAYYVIEEPEENEIRSCNTEYIYESIGYNTFKTNDIILSPGVPRVYVDGYRQPKSSYVINSINSFTILDPVLTRDNPLIMIKNDRDENELLTVNDTSSIYVEVRQDYTLQEKTVVITDENLADMKQGTTLVVSRDIAFENGQKLPYELFLSTLSEINVYINGASYGKDLSKVKNQDILVLNNPDIVKLLVAGDKITFEWR